MGVEFSFVLLLQEAGIASFMYLEVVGIPPKTFSWKLACPCNRLVHVNNACSIWSMAIISSLPSLSYPVIAFNFSTSSLNEVFIASLNWTWCSIDSSWSFNSPFSYVKLKDAMPVSWRSNTTLGPGPAARSQRIPHAPMDWPIHRGSCHQIHDLLAPTRFQWPIHLRPCRPHQALWYAKPII